MITIYERGAEGIKVSILSGSAQLSSQAVWIDLLNASNEELKAVELVMGIEIPTSDAMHDLEVSSKLYLGKGALYMIADIVDRQGTAQPEMHPTTFILSHNRLVTVRYGQTRPLATFAAHVQKDPSLLRSGEEALMAMLELIIGQTGQLMRELAGQIDSVSRIIFWQAAGQEDKTIAAKLGLRSALYGVGHAGEVVARAQESLMSIDRLLGFYTEFAQPAENSPLANRLVGMQRDVQSLSENGEFLSQKTGFLLDATLGFINAEQNQIIKIFSVAAVILLPPTLVATIYGMNFEFMPELAWAHGYVFAIVLMFIAGFLPFLYFKRRGWI